MFKIINQLFKIEKKRISILFLMMFIAGLRLIPDALKAPAARGMLKKL